MRFFFHVTGSGVDFRDEEGEDLASAEEARDYAARIAHDLRHDAYRGCMIRVTDEAGTEIARVPMDSAELS